MKQNADPETDQAVQTPVMPTWSVYLIRCRYDSLYTGIATNVQRRLREHEDGPGGARYLRGKGPLELVFHAPAGNRSQASRLEARIKRLTRAQKLRLASGDLSLEELITSAHD